MYSTPTPRAAGNVSFGSIGRCGETDHCAFLLDSIDDLGQLVPRKAALPDPDPEKPARPRPVDDGGFVRLQKLRDIRRTRLRHEADERAAARRAGLLDRSGPIRVPLRAHRDSPLNTRL